MFSDLSMIEWFPTDLSSALAPARPLDVNLELGKPLHLSDLSRLVYENETLGQIISHVPFSSKTVQFHLGVCRGPWVFLQDTPLL